MTDEGAKILIIEDEALIAREIAHRLTNLGWEVVGTAFGAESVQLALDTQPDLILSDIHLRHGLSGIDLAQEIQNQMDVPVVFLTAYSDEDTVAKAKMVTPFGYIIKPVDNRDLQITIEMALYKFRVEKELREKQQLLQTALACIGNALVFLDKDGQVINANPDATTLLGGEPETGSAWRDLLGDARSVTTIVDTAIKDQQVAKLPPFLMQRINSATKLVDGIVGPMDEGAVLILRDLGDIEDPVAIQPSEQFAQLGADQLSPSESTFCQLLLSPDDVGDTELVPIIDHVRATVDTSLRSTDLVSVFGHSLVSISMPYTDVAEGEQIATSLLEQLQGYQFGGRTVTFSAGLAHSTGGDQEPIELFRRASSALDTARRSGGDRLWIDYADRRVGSREIQGGKDYRHVVLLWNVMNALASAENLSDMCAEFCAHLFQVFQANRTALLSLQDDRLNLEVGYINSSEKTEHISDLQLSESEFATIRETARGQLNRQLLNNTVLLPVADRWVLLVSGPEIAEDDATFLGSLVTYFASAIARFDVPVEMPTTEVVPERTLVYESIEMQQVLDTANLAAPTDATVLIMGESGTGKELVSSYIHDQGNRRDQPMIVVDCGAVAPSLIESELFGHVKGAFTGATANFKGRLKEAAGGTVLLDEIGELPLDTQVKLLRFVQDRQVAAVGSNQYETVDARVIAATNKDLREMVDAGTFREDLYYRLNVFTISVPPLRDRRTDIVKIATHFLGLFAKRYNKTVTGFTNDAESALLQYDWPGNIRELSNVINRAVILSKDQLITPIQLGVFTAAESLPEPVVTTTTTWRTMLQAVVDIGASTREPLPVGRYLEEDFILMSLNRHDGVLNRAALTIGVPESTLRRRIQKIEEIYGSTDPDRPGEWPVTNELYEEVMRTASVRELPPLELLSAMILSEIEAKNLNKSTSAQLLGVSLPTYRRMASESAEIYQ